MRLKDASTRAGAYATLWFIISVPMMCGAWGLARLTTSTTELLFLSGLTFVVLAGILFFVIEILVHDMLEHREGEEESPDAAE